MIEALLRAARDASRSLLSLTVEQTDSLLTRLADALESGTADILAANAADLALLASDYPYFDRLQLTEARIQDMAEGLRQVATLPSPLGRVLMETERPNGMKIRKVSVPFGVIGIIYEARPNVTTDVFSLCFKAGSACVLKGGKEAAGTNAALVQIIHTVLTESGLSTNLCTLLPADHEATTEMLRAVGLIDLVIPRGSSRLINYVRDNARVPVIETGAGICHTYFDLEGDLQKGAAIVNNGKTRRVGVCNALDCLLVHAGRLADLPALVAPLVASKVLLYADEPAYAALEEHYPAHLLEHALPEHYGTEMLSYRLAIKTVQSLDEALDHIAHYSSRHSESIISNNAAACERFTREVDAACVYTNLPTSWTDGGQFGFGAEIGISTQKLHARGPMALPEITTYKYVITGDGQIRQ
jgi:glutamate-5-semialdehyde dehydrogenase